MFLLNWYREFIEIKNDRVCQGCETYRQQLEIANYEKQELLKKLLHKEPEPSPIIEGEKVTVPKTIPWNVRKQMLEREDREKARSMRNAAQPDTKSSVDDLEKELDIASAEREAKRS